MEKTLSKPMQAMLRSLPTRGHDTRVWDVRTAKALHRRGLVVFRWLDERRYSIILTHKGLEIRKQLPGPKYLTGKSNP